MCGMRGQALKITRTCLPASTSSSQLIPKGQLDRRQAMRSRPNGQHPAGVDQHPAGVDQHPPDATWPA
jgi:hypothetical protein